MVRLVFSRLEPSLDDQVSFGTFFERQQQMPTLSFSSNRAAADAAHNGILDSHRHQSALEKK